MEVKLKKPQLTKILENRVPALTERMCDAIDDLLNSDDIACKKVAMASLSHLLPYVLPKKTEVNMNVSGTISDESADAIKQWLNGKKH